MIIICRVVFQSQSSPGDLGGTAGVGGQRDGKFHEAKCLL